jgi:V/A-type H+-transporting ATPase subunit E
MKDDLSHLIERIQAEAVEEAQAKADSIVSAARSEADAILSRAEAEAKAIKAKAEKDAEQYTQRSRRTLEQAARDLLITVGEGVENIFSDLVAEAVHEAMDIDVLKNMLANLAGECLRTTTDRDIAVLVRPEDQDALVSFFAERYRQKLAAGIELRTDSEILQGFRVSIKDEYVYLDFTAQAVAKALTRLLRPHLAEIVTHATQIRLGVGEACNWMECPTDRSEK